MSSSKPAAKNPVPDDEMLPGSAKEHAALHGRIKDLEDEVARYRAGGLRPDSGSLQERPDVVRHMETAFGDLERVIRVSYDILQDGTWRVVAVHAMDDKGKALRSICKKSVEIQDAFDGVAIDTLVLHEDEVRDEHLAGTSLVFSRA